MLLLAALPASAGATTPVPQPVHSHLNFVQRVSPADIGTQGGAGLPRFALRSRPSGKASASRPRVYLGGSFAGLTSSQCGCDPPDVQVAAGPTAVVEFVNTAGRIYPRDGSAPTSFSLADFFGTGADDISDPQIQYDALTGRWFATMMEVSHNGMELAVSDGSDPSLGHWSVYGTSAGTDACPDQPRLGMNDLGVFLAVELFTGDCHSEESAPVGGIVLMAAKADLLSAVDSPRVDTFGNLGYKNIGPAQELSHSNIEYLSAAATPKARLLRVFEYSGTPGGGGRISRRYSLKLKPSLDAPPAATQPGARTPDVDTEDNRITDATWKAGTLTVAANDLCFPDPHDARPHSCVRLLTASTTQRRLRYDNEIGFAFEDDWDAALRPDATGTVNIVFAFSAADEYPSSAVMNLRRGRLSSNFKVLAKGRGPTDNRFGDYFGAAVDPVNSHAVWVAGEYGPPAGSADTWLTRIGVVSSAPFSG